MFNGSPWLFVSGPAAAAGYSYSKPWPKVRVPRAALPRYGGPLTPVSDGLLFEHGGGWRGGGEVALSASVCVAVGLLPGLPHVTVLCLVVGWSRFTKINGHRIL